MTIQIAFIILGVAFMLNMALTIVFKLDSNEKLKRQRWSIDHQKDRVDSLRDDFHRHINSNERSHRKHAEAFGKLMEYLGVMWVHTPDVQATNTIAKIPVKKGKKK